MERVAVTAGPVRILEVGGNILLKFAVPAQVEQFWCGLRPYGWGHPDTPLGPLAMPKKFEDWDREMATLETTAANSQQTCECHHHN